MLFRYFSISLLLTCLLSVSYAQDFEKGYIITTKKDKVVGYIQVQKKKDKTEGCVFKTSLTTQDVKTYQPSELLGYRYEGGSMYKSYKLEEENFAKTVFVEVVVQGEVSLYDYLGRFFVEKDGMVEELVIEETATYVGEQKAIKKNNKYLKTLQKVMSDCSEIPEKLKYVRKHIKALVEVVEFYNQCKGAEYQNYLGEKAWAKWRVGFFGSVDVHQVSFKNTKTSLAVLDEGFDAVLGTFGLNFNMTFPRMTKKSMFQTGLWFTPLIFSQERDVPAGLSEISEDVKVSGLSLKVPLALHHRFSKKKVSPHVLLGVTARVNFLNATLTRDERIVGATSTTFNKIETEIETPMIQAGFLLGLGMSGDINQKGSAFFIEGRFEPATRMLSTTQPSQHNTMSLALGFNF